MSFQVIGQQKHMAVVIFKGHVSQNRIKSDTSIRYKLSNYDFIIDNRFKKHTNLSKYVVYYHN